MAQGLGMEIEMDLTNRPPADSPTRPPLPSSPNGQQVQPHQSPKQAYASPLELDSEESTGKLTNRKEEQDRIDDGEASQRVHEVTDSSAMARIPYPISNAAWVIIMVGSMERMAFYGGSTPFQNYIQRSAHEGHDRPGRLGLGQMAATGLNQYFYFLSYLTPVLASAICDSVSGKYTVIFVSSIAGIAGWAIIAGTSVESVPVSGALAGLIIGMAAVAASSGGVSSIIPAFAADQAHGEGMTVVPAKESTMGGPFASLSLTPMSKRAGQKTAKVVYDASLNVQHIFHWYYLCINAIGLVGSVATPFIELYTRYVYVYLFATGAIVLGTGILLLGRPLFTMVEPQKGLMTDCIGSVKLSWTERKKARSNEVACIHFLDRSKVSYQAALYGANSGHGVADKTVEDLKQALRTLRILPVLTVFWLAFNQCSHNLLSQAAQMRRPSWLSNDLMGNTNPIALTFIVPAFDHYIFPWLRRRGWEPTPVKRMTLGFLLASLSMVYAAVLQSFIYRTGPYFDHPGARSNDVSIWWQLPPYIILALAEIFAVITALEYAYNMSPDSMKTIVSAMNCVPNSVASLIVYILLPVSKDPYYTWNFAIVALLSFITMVGFWLGFRTEDLQAEQEADEKHRDALKLKAS